MWRSEHWGLKGKSKGWDEDSRWGPVFSRSLDITESLTAEIQSLCKHKAGVSFVKFLYFQYWISLGHKTWTLLWILKHIWRAEENPRSTDPGWLLNLGKVFSDCHWSFSQIPVDTVNQGWASQGPTSQANTSFYPQVGDFTIREPKDSVPSSLPACHVSPYCSVSLSS